MMLMYLRRLRKSAEEPAISAAIVPPRYGSDEYKPFCEVMIGVNRQIRAPAFFRTLINRHEILQRRCEGTLEVSNSINISMFLDNTELSFLACRQSHSHAWGRLLLRFLMASKCSYPVVKRVMAAAFALASLEWAGRWSHKNMSLCHPST